MSNEICTLYKKPVNLILGLTGSVASIKLDDLVEKLTERFIHINICIVPTKNAQHFIPGFQENYNQSLPTLNDRLAFIKSDSSLSNQEKIRNQMSTTLSFVDEDEWTSWSKRNDPVLHIELRKWADLLVIAPLDANTMGKICNGLCDNLLTSILRAWDIKNIKRKPVVICPAMNTLMYTHPLTKIQLDMLVNQFGFKLVDSISKLLMCNDFGIGAMASLHAIVDSCWSSLRFED